MLPMPMPLSWRMMLPALRAQIESTIRQHPAMPDDVVSSARAFLDSMEKWGTQSAAPGITATKGTV